MKTDLTLHSALDIERELRTWRTRALNALLTVTAIAAAPVIGTVVFEAFHHPEQWPVASAYLVMWLCLVGLAAFRRLDPYLRAWGLLLLGYAAAAQALALGGLAGDGRVFLVALPMAALILVGVRSGMIMSVISLLTFAAFAVAAHLGWMTDWLIISDNPLEPRAWLYEGIVVGMCLAALITLQRHLYRFLTTLVIEKARLGEATQTSQILHRTVSALTSDFAYVVRPDPGGRLLVEEVPETFTRITGYTPDEVSTFDRWETFVYPDDVPIFHQHLQTLLSGQSCVSELRILTKSGQVRWLRVYGQPLWDEEQERVVRIYGAVRDITRRKQAEESLDKRAAQLALLNDIGGKIATVLELNSVLERAARLVQEGFGYHHVALFILDPERGDLVMKARAGDFANLFPREHRIRLGQGMVGWVGHHGERLLANDVRAEPLYINFFPDVIPTCSELSTPIRVGEETVGVLDVQSPRLNAFDENDVMVIETVADQVAAAIENARLYEAAQRELAERKKAEEALRESEEMARAILNATTESVFLIDDQQIILTMNKTAAQRFGKDEEELVGLRVQDIHSNAHLSPALAESREARIREVIRSGKSVRFEDERGGIIFDNSIYPVLDARGKVTRLAVFARDITAQRRAEQQVIRARRLAVMGQLVASLAHEINNPLQIIRSNLELVLDFGLEPDEQKSRLDTIRREIERLIDISLRMLDFAHPPDDTRCPVSITRLVKDTLALVGRQLQMAHVQVTTDLPADLPYFSAVPHQISQVLLNLGINAIEAMGDGGHLRIAARADGDVLALTMANDGPPIPEEHIERIFEPFFTTKPDGTGLGLSICHSIVQQHGGAISVENLKDGKGVLFTITLPIARPTSGQEAGV